MASYIETVLGPDEKVEVVTKVSWMALYPLIVLGFIVICVGAYYLMFSIVAVGLLIWAAAYIRQATTELAVTNQKIISKFGFIKRHTVEMLLPKVESIQVDQSIMGRLLNYGTVIISGAGNPQAPVPGINNPIEFRRKFMEVQAKALK